MLRRTTQIALGTALVAAAAAFAPAAHADRVGFNVSIGGPGYGVAFGNGPYWRGSPLLPALLECGVYRAAGRATRRRSITAPPRRCYRAPRVVYRAPYVVRRPVVVGRPVYYGY